MKTVIKMCTILAFSLCLFSCQSEEDKRKEWLEKNILKYFDKNNYEIRSEIQKEIFSIQYLEYKSDAIGTIYDGMSEEEFKIKWENIFDTRYAGADSPLLSCGTDDPFEAKIKISFKEKINDAYFYNYTLQGCPQTIIKIVSDNNSYKIVDILEGILIRKQNF